MFYFIAHALTVLYQKTKVKLIPYIESYSKVIQIQQSFWGSGVIRNEFDFMYDFERSGSVQRLMT